MLALFGHRPCAQPSQSSRLRVTGSRSRCPDPRFPRSRTPRTLPPEYSAPALGGLPAHPSERSDESGSPGPALQAMSFYSTNTAAVSIPIAYATVMTTMPRPNISIPALHQRSVVTAARAAPTPNSVTKASNMESVNGLRKSRQHAIVGSIDEITEIVTRELRETPRLVRRTALFVSSFEHARLSVMFHGL